MNAKKMIKRSMKKGRKKIKNAANVTAAAVVIIPTTVMYAASPKFRKKLDDMFTG